MLRSSPFRRLKVRAKHALDVVRPYPWVTGLSPWPRWTAETLGSVIHREARVRGRLTLFEPAWFQMNRGSECRQISVPEGHFLYIGENADLEGRTIRNHTMVLRDRVLEGDAEPHPRQTLSVDLEGNTAVCPGDSPKSRAVQQEAARQADRIHRLFQEFGLKSVWYVVGSLLNDSLMKPLCERLIQDPNVDVGWHTQNHMNYFTADEDDVQKDMENANKVRELYKISLNAMAFPYNAPGHMETVLAHGFSKIRGYVGQLDLPFTVQFDGFTFFGSSLFLGPFTAATCIRSLDRQNGALNIFMHPVDWIGHNLTPLRTFIERYNQIPRP